MQDTPEHIKQIQLDIWLAKSPSERLERFILDNDNLFKLWEQAKKQILSNNSSETHLYNYKLLPK
jgi:hypothetical protein